MKGKLHYKQGKWFVRWYNGKNLIRQEDQLWEAPVEEDDNKYLLDKMLEGELLEGKVVEFKMLDRFECKIIID